MRILITGGSGFIGSNVAQKFVDYGHSVTVADDMSNGRKEFVPLGVDHFWMEDFAGPRVLSAVSKQEFDVILHLAALPRVSFSVEHPVKTHDVNVNKTLKLMETAKGNVKRFVFSSSSSVYGNAKNLPTSESEVRDPQSPYALQKYIIEDYLKLYYKLYQFECCSLRYFNVFGKNQLGNSPYSTAISAWLTAIKINRVCRSDGTGEQSRDMCHVDNVVDANFRAASTTKSLNAEAFNIACGDCISNNEILTILKERYPKMQVVSAPFRPGDVMHTQANVAKAEEWLGYRPLVRVREGLEKTIKWFDTNPNALLGVKL
jgi:UDP-N-acetylglucosamine/UDP-N-acetylgalactosamine 4-epimerase